MSTTSDFNALWKTAIQRYEAETKTTLADLSLTNLSVTEILDVVVKNQAEFKAYRDKYSRLRDVLKPFSTSVKLLADVLSNSVKLVSPLACFLCRC